MNIIDEAVEAAARVISGVPYGFEKAGRRYQESIRTQARAALEAAAPHLVAEAYDRGFEDGRERGGWEEAPVTEEPKFTNPYRSTGAVG